MVSGQGGFPCSGSPAFAKVAWSADPFATAVGDEVALQAVFSVEGTPAYWDNVGVTGPTVGVDGWGRVPLIIISVCRLWPLVGRSSCRGKIKGGNWILVVAGVHWKVWNSPPAVLIPVCWRLCDIKEVGRPGARSVLPVGGGLWCWLLLLAWACG
jgi:hypothetical protein